MSDQTDNASARDKKFDRAMGAVVGMPDVIHTKPTTVRAATPIAGDVSTFIVQTFRRRSEDGKDGGDTIFIEYVDTDGAVRIVIPPNVSRVIAAHRDALTDRSRSRAAKALAAERKAAGIVPGFLRGKKKGK